MIDSVICMFRKCHILEALRETSGFQAAGGTAPSEFLTIRVSLMGT